ncbi:oxygen-dependent protoporphyrinogen oxidase [Georgenia soli]|uniref:Oxygen-dependent protoporphyrinogen oxidase n=1 Tax=Georgenia soli TaxID=638953 RepID=A0A2A9EP45_9MICO|nr:FAD-dependent oxidoreductase [Georgenia soli]PFG40032.1 oxygen-dependent protoporphyrinogen oxidase [Georgenia soli]
MTASRPPAPPPSADDDGTLDAVVAGAGVAGLVAARTLALQGLRPLVLEAGEAVGGLVTGGVVGGLEVDLGAEAFALRRPEVRALADELGLPVEVPTGGSWVYSAGRAFPIPAESILGIPADPSAPDVAPALGPEGTARAAQDAELDPAVGADAQDLAGLVRARMGEAVLDRLVRPVAGGIHAADPADLAADAVVPGLRAALAEHGSLAAAVRALRSAAPSGSAVATTTGGLFRLPRALAGAVAAAGGEVRTRTTVTGLRRAGGVWEVDVLDEGAPARLRARRVVLATPGRAALDLLAQLLPGPLPDLPAGTALTHVTLAVRAPALDRAPRGSGLLVAPGPGPVRAKALTHASAKWPWLAAATAAGEHVLRLSYGRPGEPPAGVDVDRACSDAELLLGEAIAEVRDAVVVAREGALAPTTPAHREAVAELQARAAALPGLAVTGSWVAGTGLASVVPHARAAASALAPQFPQE